MATLTTVNIAGLPSLAHAHYHSPPSSPHPGPRRRDSVPGKSISSILNNINEQTRPEKDAVVGTLAERSQAAGGPGGSASGGSLSRSGSISGPVGGNSNGGGGAGGQSGTAAGGAGPVTAAVAASKRRDRPCDACRKRKSRCVLNEGQTSCVLCQFHSQDCTFVQSPAPRKRRIASETPAKAQGTNSGPTDSEARGSKKRYVQCNGLVAEVSDGEPSTEVSRSTEPDDRTKTEESSVQDYSQLRGPSLLKTTLGLQKSRHALLIGGTSEYEECLISLCALDSKDEYELSQNVSYRRVSGNTTFLIYPDANKLADNSALDKIEDLVSPHGPALIDLYFRIVHPSFPILHKRVFLEKYARSYREFSPPLLAAVYALACTWWSYSPDLSGKDKPDVRALEEIARRTLQDCIASPKLSTVQAGLLLLQRHIPGAWPLTAQMVAIGQDLGLHRDPSGWKIPAWEKGLRKRLSWALFTQDKWAALTHGRPSHIVDRNWDVPDVSASDFPETKRDDEGAEDGSVEIEKGRLIFEQMIKLSRLTAAILEAFFTDGASISAHTTIKDLLDRAKPIQIRLREWYASLPAPLKMDTASKPRSLNATGALHLSYFATEITLHRILLRSTLALPAAAHLPPIIRSAAKTRLISALDFINRLTPSHLQSFWPSHSRGAFSLVGAFGALLWASSPTVKEGSFYLARLKEYRWTLRVSLRSLEELRYPLEVLEEMIRDEKVERWKEAVAARTRQESVMSDVASMNSPRESEEGMAEAMSMSSGIDEDLLEAELGVGMVGFGGEMGGFVGFGGFGSVPNQSSHFGGSRGGMPSSTYPSSTNISGSMPSFPPSRQHSYTMAPAYGSSYNHPISTAFAGFDDDGAMGSESEDAYEEFDGSEEGREEAGEDGDIDMDGADEELRRARERGSGFLMMPEDSN